MIHSKPIMILIHVGGWLLFFTLMMGFVSTSPGGKDLMNQLLSPYFVLFCFVYIFLFYFNTGFLIPTFYFNKNYVAYFSILLVLFIAVYFLKPFDHLMSHNQEPPPGHGYSRTPPPPGEDRRPVTDIISLILFVMVSSLSVASGLIKQGRLVEQRAARAEADKANAELSFLKAQINPHFLFNTLNNIYSLALTKSENAAVAIMKLSHIMRYMTDEASQELVPLEYETDCIRDYIDLHRMRLSKKVSVEFSVKGDPTGKMISPLIFMSFIENVFKYGISTHETSVITINVSSEEKMISFFCQNQVFNTGKSEQRNGIGIANTKQRLEHLYPNKHTLNIKTSNGLYTVDLKLNV